MRLLWTFLFLGCLLNKSYVSSEDSSHGSDVENGDDDGLDTELLNSNEGEYTHMEDDSEKLASMTVTSSTKIAEVDPDSVDKLDQPKMDASDSLDTSGTTSQRAGNLNEQLSTPVLNQDILSQEGLLSPLILNNQNLATEREELLTLLLGGSLSFGIRNDLLEAAGTKAVEGLICKGSLGGLCGHGSLSGMNDVLKNMNSGQLNSWLNVTRFDIVRLSWNVFASSRLELKLQTKLTINFSGMLSFLSGSTVDVDIVIPLDLHQTEPGQVSFSVKSCQAIFSGIQVNTGMFSTMMESMMKWSLNISLPNILCPVVRFWFYIINQQLTILKNIASLGMLGDNNLPSTPQPILFQRSYHMDFKDKSFPASFINWLIKETFDFMESHVTVFTLVP
ncbi:BPI fold-containing family B member 3-like [Peromyscus californicus insignis]|uniref:BPI fold-containing family B member 3-like n=1 Tax=Peromyscus californicus insignis TaxID=564181 RepID=UPI0022A7902C|nr:BPI fold-containing family B member 3-like [Peromyscus californicus insignis]